LAGSALILPFRALRVATEIDAKFRVMALEDSDLKPLRASMSAERSGRA